MKLELKSEYNEWSIGGGKTLKRKLKNICPSEYERLFKAGYNFFFDVEVEPVLKSSLKSKKTDDTDKPTGE
jgi:hypothetical protein